MTRTLPTSPGVDRRRLGELLAAERERFRREHPRSARLHAQGREHLLAGVPMTWMAKAAGGFPLALASARGARVTDVDGVGYADFALGDTGAMAGHSPDPLVRAVRRRVEQLGGVTAMMPTEDAAVVAAELTRRFGVPAWSFALTATDANRWVLRLARHVTRRPKVLVHSWCYHGTVDETLVVLDSGRVRSRAGNVGPQVDPAATTRVVETNDLAGLERELAHGDVACVLIEPALTNIGIVLPEPGYLEGVRALTRQAGALLVHDETHTFSAGPGGVTGRDGLSPDVVTIGKAIAGGVPCAAYGLSAELAERVAALRDADLVDTGGVGGTLAGNALSLAAARAVLTEVLTDDAFPAMVERATRFSAGVRDVVARHGLPWSVSQLGARTEYRFTDPPPRTGGASAAAADTELEDYLHVHAANRGVLLTPFHSMALMSPGTTDADVDLHTEVFGEAVAALLS